MTDHAPLAGRSPLGRATTSHQHVTDQASWPRRPRPLTGTGPRADLVRPALAAARVHERTEPTLPEPRLVVASLDPLVSEHLPGVR